MRDKLIQGEKKIVIQKKMKQKKRVDLDEEASVNDNALDNKQFTDEIPLRALALLGGFLIIIGSLLDYIDQQELQQAYYGVSHAFFSVTFCIWIVGLFIINLEGRPFDLEASFLQKTVLNKIKILNSTRGRGIFYVMVGLLQFVLFTSFNIVCGLYMVTVGVLFILCWSRSRSKISKLSREILKKDSVKAKFYLHDKDRDGYLNVEEFREFVKDTDIEFSINDFEAIFTEFDSNIDKKISLQDIERHSKLSPQTNSFVRVV